MCDTRSERHSIKGNLRGDRTSFGWRFLGLIALMPSLLIATEPRAQDNATTTLVLTEEGLGQPLQVPASAGGTRRIPCGRNEVPGRYGEQPTRILQYQSQVRQYQSQAGPALIIAARSDEVDLTLAVQTPSGTWRCIDDVEDFDPVIGILEPITGRYEIWIGTYRDVSAPVEAILEFSTRRLLESGPEDAQTFRAGTSRPREEKISIGGGGVSLEADVSLEMALGGDCFGYVWAEPIDRFNYDRAGRRNPLLLQLQAPSAAFPVLVVRAPNRRWYCEASEEPQVSFRNPEEGYYTVYAGDLFPTTLYEATFRIMEVAAPDLRATPFLGEMSLDRAVERGTYALQAGGPIDTSLGIRDSVQSCVGYISRRPHLVINNVPAGAIFNLRVDSTADTTLIVHESIEHTDNNEPAGTWHCDDDSGSAFDPSLRILAREGGVYRIFVGNYEPVRRRNEDDEHLQAPANLYISRE
jgi:hypothetical protein